MRWSPDSDQTLYRLLRQQEQKTLSLCCEYLQDPKSAGSHVQDFYRHTKDLPAPRMLSTGPF